jgi:methionine biosynthesis protein MetW
MSGLLAGVLRKVDATIATETSRIAEDGFVARRLLDVGCWDGAHTASYAERLGCPACGIEVFEAQASAAEARGIEVARVDLESGRFPWPDGHFDVVISNQVFEHLKNVWLAMSEVYRVLAPGGWLILSVPNLGSLHNRVLLALGRQPTSIRTFGPHVRGYTFGEIRDFVAHRDRLEVVRMRGVGFYPFPASMAVPLTRIWPGASHTTIVVARKVARDFASPWAEWMRGQQAGGLQTFYGD